MKRVVDLDALHAALGSRRRNWSGRGLSIGPFTWRDSSAAWPRPLETTREAVSDPESLGRTVTAVDGPAEGYAELVFWRGGWADVNAFDGHDVFSERPVFTDIGSCVVMADDVVNRLERHGR